MILLTPTDVRPALQAKLAEVTSCVHELRHVEQPRLTPRMDGWEIVAKLLATARAIYQMAETFVESRPGTDFDTWCAGWLASLTELQRELWHHMRDAGGEVISADVARGSTGIAPKAWDGLVGFRPRDPGRTVKRLRCWFPWNGHLDREQFCTLTAKLFSNSGGGAVSRLGSCGEVTPTMPAFCAAAEATYV